ncbi:adenosylmethionine-8-amino-7-oxononanoate aminotransferase [Endozoicomonas montiporae]|uniref:Adenosylmethionine-8-amino-7-oxononanoate aminotransferase n=2 Tax=Endozoicomonas montiporae TaxID=1027273 RepID=A0A081N8S0_9GAMM|nr:adenosylmethionine--8-amino-7-oxononanoate transaminase [Endozoicomonas montiporae]AMO55248.1 adenosylmethionine-8-amino-7-oxononanoate aminotransferase [Endozoicomonas montiporae CL-33]KEQ14843.1 adenosylmethionine-8-amino-7-oxononanoate aminotransferase [Endozoicomonas montiporae]
MHNLLSTGDLEFESRHIWHPYNSTNSKVPVFPVTAANGVKLTLNDGREIIDGMSSWWCMAHGYNHPQMNQAMKAQIDTFSHVMFGGLTHKPAIDLARKLVEMTPEPIQTVFFADSGSVAVEVAIKMAMQYWVVQGNTRKTKMLTFRGGYYGDTTGAMSVCDPVGGMHSMFTGLLPEHHFVPRPACKFDEPFDESHISEFKNALESMHENVAAVIIEPVVQGAGGMYFYSPDFLKRVRELCDEYNVLLIHDEIATGFGRTGKLFACEHANTVPDIMTVGKALTGGYMTLAATLCTEKVSGTISENGAIMHGPTFMANPLACAAACASLDIFATGEWKAQVANIEQKLRDGLMPCAGFDTVAEVRILGAIGVIEMKEPVVMEEIQPMFVDEGIWVRPFGKLVYIMPPYIISDDDLAFLCQQLCKVISRI